MERGLEGVLGAANAVSRRRDGPSGPRLSVYKQDRILTLGIDNDQTVGQGVGRARPLKRGTCKLQSTVGY